MRTEMTGRQRVMGALVGEKVDRPALLPMIHTGLAGFCGVSLREFFTDADVMARVIENGWRRFAYDGVQLSLGVIGEAEALGAAVEQPPDGAPVLREHLLADLDHLDRLRERDPAVGGRMPLFFAAVEKVMQSIGNEAFVLATLRGPCLIASQLRGAAEILVDLLERPEEVGRVLEFTTGVAKQVSRALLTTGAHGLLLGEATCSPSFISPALYREMILPHHRRLVAALKQMGWRFVGLHVCGNTAPIIEDLISTGADFLDVDYQVPAPKALALAAGRVALRGNLDPSSVFRFGTVEKVKAETEALLRAVTGTRWIVGSGCDIPPGTPAENIAACVQAVKAAAG